MVKILPCCPEAFIVCINRWISTFLRPVCGGGFRDFLTIITTLLNSGNINEIMSRKRRNNNQDIWKQFEKRCADKRTAPPKEQPQSVPEDIMVQRIQEILAVNAIFYFSDFKSWKYKNCMQTALCYAFKALVMFWPQTRVHLAQGLTRWRVKKFTLLGLYRQIKISIHPTKWDNIWVHRIYRAHLRQVLLILQKKIFCLFLHHQSLPNPFLL